MTKFHVVVVYRPVSEKWDVAYKGASEKEARLVAKCLADYAFGSVFDHFTVSGCDERTLDAGIAMVVEDVPIPPRDYLLSRFLEIIEPIGKAAGLDRGCVAMPDGEDGGEGGASGDPVVN